jgi:8-oxo-dGTP pyrophosphatase MutT (NUDIX family)
MYIGAGIIIHNNKKQVLLVCDARSGRWGFPKGHPEPVDENLAINTAIRECYEETGMKIVDDYIIENSHPKRIGKRLYFSGVALRDSFRSHNKNMEEIKEIGWWTLEELIANESILNSDLRCWLSKKKRLRSPLMTGSSGPLAI